MKLQTYAAFSFLATTAAVYHAFSSRGQFYPAMVYLSTSKICFVLLLNMGLVMMCITWQLVKRFFLGSLREAEVERLNEQSWREVMEILFAITIFRQDFSVMFLAMVTALLLIKALHWLAQKRVEYIETTPAVPKLSHIRIVSFMGFLLLVDCLFLFISLKSLIQTWEASVFLFFAFESYGVPLHLIRELYETFRSFRMRVADYIRYRKITSNMNERFPDATAEELNASDATCIICREEMVTAKKLRCGHLFHVHCLRSWLERQHTCPTCRALVAPPENGSAAVVNQQAVPSDLQPGPAVAGTTQASEAGAANQNQSLLQAAAMAAKVYEKSFVHLPTNQYICPPGYTVLPQIPKAEASNGQLLKNQPISNQHNAALFQVPGSSIGFRETTLGNSNLQGSPLKIEKLIQSQIELLQAQLQALEQLMAEQSKAKSAAASSSSSVPASSDCGCHGEAEDADTD
ncbi:ERAD-associated E3 ubiquitin-protein ligase HRD1 isoform X2 [Dendrobium catenatum]|uniref:ERAD-associated E3 ubiquitin-protein ligase HRD1 isoform X2 n=1 Tax=Dendrobium catenatum TaxID=906689 RepID=UPI0009F46B81|nr:ERAD-associated E3 ubiquitin-protein ligase HRD1 isoform X2 [Dendrobium catenatum]